MRMDKGAFDFSHPRPRRACDPSASNRDKSRSRFTLRKSRHSHLRPAEKPSWTSDIGSIRVTLGLTWRPPARSLSASPSPPPPPHANWIGRQLNRLRKYGWLSNHGLKGLLATGCKTSQSSVAKGKRLRSLEAGAQRLHNLNPSWKHPAISSACIWLLSRTLVRNSLQTETHNAFVRLASPMLGGVGEAASSCIFVLCSEQPVAGGQQAWAATWSLAQLGPRTLSRH